MAPLVGAQFPYPHAQTGNQEQDEDNQEQGEDKPSPLPDVGVGAPLVGALPPLGNIIGTFKSLTINEYIGRVKTKEFPPFEKSIWQRNYYERIIRNEKELNLIREYIEKNPEMWEEDELNAPSTESLTKGLR